MLLAVERMSNGTSAARTLSISRPEHSALFISLQKDVLLNFMKLVSFHGTSSYLCAVALAAEAIVVCKK